MWKQICEIEEELFQCIQNLDSTFCLKTKFAHRKEKIYLEVILKFEILRYCIQATFESLCYSQGKFLINMFIVQYWGHIVRLASTWQVVFKLGRKNCTPPRYIVLVFLANHFTYVYTLPFSKRSCNEMEINHYNTVCTMYTFQSRFAF